MSNNPNFTPDYSTDQIYVGTSRTICLTDTLDEMDTAIDGKAASTHGHNEYASVGHEHGEYAPTTHNHAQSDIEGLSTVLAGKANSTHTHTEYAVVSHTHTNYANTNHGHSYNDLSDKPTIPSAYTHPSSHPASMITGLANVATSGSYNDLSNKPTIPTIPASLPANGGNADTVDGKHATDFALAEHIHNAVTITQANTNLNDYTTAGIYTFATDEKPINIPVGVNGWLFVIPWRNGSTTIKQIWMRHGTVGENDCDIYVRTKVGDEAWGVWRAIYITSPSCLWSGAKFMTADHSITPSKPLSQCQHGWILEWCDYDTSTSTANDFNYVQTPIYKRNINGAWIGQNTMVCVPSYIGDDGSGATFALKQLRIYDTKIEGHAANGLNNANKDVVLRAVYEF